jgi:hypothetical protein
MRQRLCSSRPKGQRRDRIAQVSTLNLIFRVENLKAPIFNLKSPICDLTVFPLDEALAMRAPKCRAREAAPKRHHPSGPQAANATDNKRLGEGARHRAAKDLDTVAQRASVA